MLHLLYDLCLHLLQLQAHLLLLQAHLLLLKMQLLLPKLQQLQVEPVWHSHLLLRQLLLQSNRVWRCAVRTNTWQLQWRGHGTMVLWLVMHQQSLAAWRCQQHK
jgi:hypothetical protein